MAYLPPVGTPARPAPPPGAALIRQPPDPVPPAGFTLVAFDMEWGTTRHAGHPCGPGGNTATQAFQNAILGIAASITLVAVARSADGTQELRCTHPLDSASGWSRWQH